MVWLRVLMTSARKPVRIIEKKHREIARADEAFPFEKTTQQKEREMVRTVKSWIDGRRKVVDELVAANTAGILLRLGDDRQ
jgi:hypothetical protein